MTLLAGQPGCIVAMDACATSHHWSHVAKSQGHEVRLVQTAYVKPFCQRRSKIGPRGGAKMGHFGFARDAGDGRRPVSRALHVAGG